MENKNTFQPVIILSIVSILLSVFAIAADAIVQKVNGGYTSAYIVLFISAIALGVLYLASATTKKQKMLDAINLVTNIVLIVFGSIVAIIEYTSFINGSDLDLLYGIRFAVGLVVMVVAILKIIYFFISRNSENIRKIYKTISLVTVICLGCYFLLFLAHESLIAYRGNYVPFIHLFLFVATIIIFALISLLSPRSDIIIPEEKEEEVKVIEQKEEQE